ncbi:HAD-IIB family hydrolase [Microbacterium sp. MEC084]|uniref:HAD-IIB family hydrolase n=1 Tax=unclassified Microbacterium TaxID=2609290 RepID=UPI0006FBDA68|nr:MULTISPECIES: HAD-IIB family hydrolase [unclassified Microbacterium]KQY96255.1 HAD family hydrolase [Microbacterium sp. Root53]MCD1269442.1 HAD-IIB family hydrolase [Microbacterium sp. MEC084]
MTFAPRVVAFDLDDTLAPSKSPIDPRIGELLIALADRVEVAIISGGQIVQFRTQVVERLPEAPSETLSHIHLLPTCGTQYFRFQGDELVMLYAQDLTPDEKRRALTAVEEEAKRLGLWESQTWGDILEDRGSQITFSALGQAAPVDAKKAWDPTGERKSALRDAVALRVPDLEVRSGGSTSVDITRKGIDKAYGMRRLAEETGISLADMLFYGDRLDPDGNDFPVLAMGEVECVSVEGWEDTADKLDALIPTLGVRV